MNSKRKPVFSTARSASYTNTDTHKAKMGRQASAASSLPWYRGLVCGLCRRPCVASEILRHKKKQAWRIRTYLDVLCVVPPVMHATAGTLHDGAPPCGCGSRRKACVFHRRVRETSDDAGSQWCLEHEPHFLFFWCLHPHRTGGASVS